MRSKRTKEQTQTENENKNTTFQLDTRAGGRIWPILFGHLSLLSGVKELW